MKSSDDKIVFVVGAGTGKEVNMPLGVDLKSGIANCLDVRVSPMRYIEGGDEKVREALQQLCQKRPAAGSLQQYFDAARLIRDAMPQAISIDNFIDSHRNNALVAECGKLAIAAEILRAERNSKLFVKQDNIYNKIDFRSVEKTWFNYFFQRLHLNCSQEDFPKRLKRVTVISFNYDRTLEHFLHQAIMNYYGCDVGFASEAMLNLSILHPYGTVGPLPWQATFNGIGFGAELMAGGLIQVSSSLKTFTERHDKSDKLLTRIRASVAEAKTIVFLGFAYHEINLELLYGAQNGEVLAANDEKRVFGTASGLSESDKRFIASELAAYGGYALDNVVLRRELLAASLFEEYSRSMRIPTGD